MNFDGKLFQLGFNMCFLSVDHNRKVKYPLIVTLAESNLTDFGWWILMHNYKDHVSSYEWNSFYLNTYRQYTLTYSVKSFRLLPSPYSTDCFDYSHSKEYMSRKDCIRKCRINESVDKCGGVYVETDVIEGDINVDFLNNENNCFQDLGLDKFCLKKCPRYDCFKQHIEAIVLEMSNLTELGLINKFKMVIPFEPRTVYEHKPSTEVIEFLCNWGSIVGLWFGFSILSMLLQAKRIIFIYLHKNIRITNVFMS